MAAAAAAGPVGGRPMELFMTDNCPFAQRTWIALLEKEADPYHPSLFHFRHTNYFNLDLPNTREFYLVHNTVPCGILPDGTHLKESMPMCEWADRTYPQPNPLGANDEKVKAATAKYTSGEFDTSTPMFQSMMAPNEEARKAPLAKLMRALAELSKDVSAEGPFIAGANFSIADCAVYPMVERARLYMPVFANTPFPDGPEYAGLHKWLAACEARPSVKISTADRTEESMKTYPYAARDRKGLLIESFTPMAKGVKEQARRQLRFAPAGKSSVDIAKALETKAQEEASTARVNTGTGTAADLLWYCVTSMFEKDNRVHRVAADNIRWELPFGQSIGFPPAMEGAAAWYGLLENIRGNFSDQRSHCLSVQPVSDSEAWATFHILGKRARDGSEFSNEFVLHAKSAHGKLVWVREYFDPSRFKKE